MFGFYLLFAFLEAIVCLPAVFAGFQFILPIDQAFAVTILLCGVMLLACLISKIRLGKFIYRIITLLLSILIAYFAVGFSIGGLAVAFICIYIFSKKRVDLLHGTDSALQFSVSSLLLNIPLSLYFMDSKISSLNTLGNISIVISTIAAVIVLVLKQVDDSRKFGKRNMRISSTLRKNNQLFTGVILLVLLVVSSVGHVSSIYKFILITIGKVFNALANLMTLTKTAEGQQKPNLIKSSAPVQDSQFLKIIYMIIDFLSVILLIAIFVFVLYYAAKMLVNLVKLIIRWLNSGEKSIDRQTEDGHTDEKESLLDRNLRNIANRIKDMASELFDREIPYDKLPDDISKIRRLFKSFVGKLNKSGAKVTHSATARELCRDEGGTVLGTEQLGVLLAHCYENARYGDTAPDKGQLGQLEEKLLKP